MKNEKRVIGRTDRLDFPALKLIDIGVKVDTGAYTSSIHCREIKIRTRKGKKVLGFQLLDPKHRLYTGKEIIARDWFKSEFKSSNGHKEDRYIIETDVILFGEKTKIQLSLTDRADMRYPVLIGRKVLNENFVVDVAKKNRSHAFKKKLEKK